MPTPRLNPQHIDLMQSSFSKLVPMAETASEMFYDRLFEIAPAVAPLFRNDMGSQGRKLMTTLALVVGSLHDLDTILPALQSLAVKHVNYGVGPEHYAPVGDALIWTLEKNLGDDFTPPTRQAWLSAYAVLSGAMIAAAYGRSAA